MFSQPISTSEPLSLFSRREHPTRVPEGITGDRRGPLGALPTNSFISNIFDFNQTLPIYLDPYSVWYSRDEGLVGLAISHQTAAQRAYAPGDPPVANYSNATYVRSMVLGSTDFSGGSRLQIDSINHLSANINFRNSDSQYLLIPTLQGMGFVTGIYYNLIPKISSSIGISSVVGAAGPRSNISKYVITLNNEAIWSMYVTIPSGQSVSFATSGPNDIVASNSVNGCVIQLCFGNNSAYDSAAGCYPTGCLISGSTNGSTGSYSLRWTTRGTSNSGTTLMYALPHHVQTFTSAMSLRRTDLTIDSLVCGTARGYLTNEFLMNVSIPSAVSFEPYTTIPNSSPSYTNAALSAITAAAEEEARHDVLSMSNVDSMYTSGKILDKYAYVLYVCHRILNRRDLTTTLSASLRSAIERFSNNSQIHPLNYETTWRGIVSSGGMDGDPGQDYGNSYYNDHHFHYGYHIHAAAIAAQVDSDLGGDWISSIRDWVNDLIRDVANPSSEDTYFPVSRSFDWFNGHSWARGLSGSADGKDEESSSEDYNFAYAMKMWARVISDEDMEARADLMLGVMRGAMNNYMYYSDGNNLEPAQFVGNKVSGIKFQNKIDHTTYFGTNEEYIHGIHMLPITPISSFLRGPTFVRQEWEQILSRIINNVGGGWRGILMLNVALYDPRASFNFFNGSSYNSSYLDNGMSLTWSLAYTAGVGGAS